MISRVSIRFKSRFVACRFLFIVDAIYLTGLDLYAPSMRCRICGIEPFTVGIAAVRYMDY